MDTPTPKLLRTTPTEAEAVFVVAQLDSHGIEAWNEGGLIAGFRAEAPGGGVNVFVRDEDFARADALLREDPEALEGPAKGVTPPTSPEPMPRSRPGVLGGIAIFVMILLVLWAFFK